MSRILPIIERQVGGLLTAQGRRQLEDVGNAVSLFSGQETDMIFYTAEDGEGGTMLCATISDLTVIITEYLYVG